MKDTDQERSKGFKLIHEHIASDFHKIAQNYTNKYNLRNYDEDTLMDIWQECTTNMLSKLKLEKFNAELYMNPFAYFTQIAKNTIVHEIKQNKKHWDNTAPCDFDDTLGEIEGI